MQKVKFLRDYRQHKVGDVVDLKPGIAVLLKARGFCNEVKSGGKVQRKSKRRPDAGAGDSRPSKGSSKGSN